MNQGQNSSLKILILKLRVMSSRWQHRSFLTFLPITRITNKYLWIRHRWENSTTCGWSWSISCSTSDCIIKVREAVTCWPHCPSPRLGKHSPEKFPLRLFFLWWEKRTRVDIQLSQHCKWLLGSPYSSLAPHRLQEILLSFTTRNWIMTQKRKGDYKNQHLDIDRPIS